MDVVTLDELIERLPEEVWTTHIVLTVDPYAPFVGVVKRKGEVVAVRRFITSDLAEAWVQKRKIELERAYNANA